MKLRLRTISKIYHIGSLNPKDRAAGDGVKGASQEGLALSWSPCPTAWQAIASRGGWPLHQLVREDGVFVDVMATLRDKRVVESLKEWAIETGYAEAGELVRLWNFDVEIEEWCYGLFSTGSAAAREAGLPLGKIPLWSGRESADPDFVALETIEALRPTADLFALTGLCPPDSEPEDALAPCLIAYAMKAHENGAEIDGFYFDERYEPEAFSAPRGGLFQTAVPSWSAQRIAWTKSPDRDGEIPPWSAGKTSICEINLQTSGPTP